jgi:hypothetical protein
MKSGARIVLGAASVLALTVNFTACGGSSSHDSMIAGSGASAAAGSGASNGSAAANSGGSSSINTGSDASVGIGAGGIDDSCAADVSTGKLVPLDMYIMLDVSGSMLSLTTGNVSKWDAVKSALEAFLKDQASAGLGVGLQYFPLLKPNAPTSCTTDASCGDSGPCFLRFCQGLAGAGAGIVPCTRNADCRGALNGPCIPLTECSLNTDFICPVVGDPCGPDPNGADLGTCQEASTHSCEHTTNCDAAVYAAPAQPIATLPNAAAKLIASIDGTTPKGDTPTAPALSGAIQQASSWAKAHPDHRVVAVLATDGLPTECTPTDINQVAAIAAKGVAATPSIDTFVIGVFGPDDVAQRAPSNLDTIALSGGTKSAYIVDTTKDVTAQFLAALDAIRGGKLDCAFQIPEPSNGQTLDYTKVNVRVKTSASASNLFYVGSAAGCDAASGGWYYDADPAQGATPSMIVACPASCSAFQAAQDASVEIALGCQTIVK